jgi:hypothetical protein
MAASGRFRPVSNQTPDHANTCRARRTSQHFRRLECSKLAHVDVIALMEGGQFAQAFIVGLSHDPDLGPSPRPS